ncbi:hypothetical protein M422DRAFT_249608 [Sphaerobolus stellatus SS14]|uniref:Uncharacterized protein n=1 Tax=Sphaerobolus stellatus (strain SS14) TaxID=990650 RepID=A0A0C9UUX1_SPHS4|nr:hypothetical protein M422DRAFT_249608 [Sphaerobolus stellatus SS14]
MSLTRIPALSLSPATSSAAPTALAIALAESEVNGPPAVEGWIQVEATMTQPPRNLGIMANATVSTFSLRPNTRASRTIFNTSASRSSRQTVSSGIPGPGNYTGKALRWLGEKSLQSVEQALIRNHIRRFRQNLNTREFMILLSSIQYQECRWLLARVMDLIRTRLLQDQRYLGTFEEHSLLIEIMNSVLFSYAIDEEASIILLAVSIFRIIHTSAEDDESMPLTGCQPYLSEQDQQFFSAIAE